MRIRDHPESQRHYTIFPWRNSPFPSGHRFLHTTRTNAGNFSGRGWRRMSSEPMEVKNFNVEPGWLCVGRTLHLHISFPEGSVHIETAMRTTQQKCFCLHVLGSPIRRGKGNFPKIWRGCVEFQGRLEALGAFTRRTDHPARYALFFVMV